MCFDLDFIWWSMNEFQDLKFRLDVCFKHRKHVLKTFCRKCTCIYITLPFFPISNTHFCSKMIVWLAGFIFFVYSPLVILVGAWVRWPRRELRPKTLKVYALTAWSVAWSRWLRRRPKRTKVSVHVLINKWPV